MFRFCERLSWIVYEQYAVHIDKTGLSLVSLAVKGVQYAQPARLNRGSSDRRRA